MKMKGRKGGFSSKNESKEELLLLGKFYNAGEPEKDESGNTAGSQLTTNAVLLHAISKVL
jgi:hypothetical protein